MKKTRSKKSRDTVPLKTWPSCSAEKLYLSVVSAWREARHRPPVINFPGTDTPSSYLKSNQSETWFRK
jgi:hypothetical protein